MKKGLIIACLIAILSSCVGQGKTEEYEDARYKIDSSDSLVNRLKFAVIEDGDTIAYKKLEKIYSEQKDFNFYVYSRVMVDRYNYMPATATAIYDNFRKGNIDDARRYQRLLNRYIDVNFGKSIAFWKTILSSPKWGSQSWGLPGMWAAVKSLSPRIFTFSGLTFRESTPCISGLFLKAPWEPAAWKQPT